MKAKGSYSGLDSFSLSFTTRKTELLQLSGSDARMSRINELFDAGREAEARIALRQALNDITRDLDVDRSERGGAMRGGGLGGADAVASLLLDLDF